MKTFPLTPTPGRLRRRQRLVNLSRRGREGNHLARDCWALCSGIKESLDTIRKEANQKTRR